MYHLQSEKIVGTLEAICYDLQYQMLFASQFIPFALL